MRGANRPAGDESVKVVGSLRAASVLNAILAPAELGAFGCIQDAQSRMRVPWISIVSPSITLAWPVTSAVSAGPAIASNTAMSTIPIMGWRGSTRGVKVGMLLSRFPWRNGRTQTSLDLETGRRAPDTKLAIWTGLWSCVSYLFLFSKSARVRLVSTAFSRGAFQNYIAKSKTG